MARMIAMVMRLDDGTYRALDVSRIRSIYILGKPPADATIHDTGEGGLVGDPTMYPDWDWPEPKAVTRSGNGGNGSGNGNGNGNGGLPPNCYRVGEIVICNGD